MACECRMVSGWSSGRLRGVPEAAWTPLHEAPKATYEPPLGLSIATASLGEALKGLGELAVAHLHALRPCWPKRIQKASPATDPVF